MVNDIFVTYVVQLEQAKKPREVSVAAILADVHHLFDDLVNQSAEARNEIISKGMVTIHQVRNAISDRSV